MDSTNRKYFPKYKRQSLGIVGAMVDRASFPIAHTESPPSASGAYYRLQPGGYEMARADDF